MKLETRGFLNIMVTIKSNNNFLIFLLIILLFISIPIYAKNHINNRMISKGKVFLNFNFGDYYLDVKEKRDLCIDSGELTWLRYPGFTFTEPTYWYFINGVKEPFALNISYVKNQLYDIKLISSNNYENIDKIKEIYIRKYGLEFVKEASGLGYSYTWLIKNMKIRIDRINKGRGACFIHYYSVND